MTMDFLLNQTMVYRTIDGHPAPYDWYRLMYDEIKKVKLCRSISDNEALYLKLYNKLISTTPADALDILLYHLDRKFDRNVRKYFNHHYTFYSTKAPDWRETIFNPNIVLRRKHK